MCVYASHIYIYLHIYHTYISYIYIYMSYMYIHIYIYIIYTSHINIYTYHIYDAASQVPPPKGYGYIGLGLWVYRSYVPRPPPVGGWGG